MRQTDDAPPALHIRHELQPEDRDRIRALTGGTGMFYPDEVEVAVELAAERLDKGVGCGYEFLFAERDGNVVGYVCYGPISLTVASWDLYWIAVDRGEQGKRIGARLLGEMEREIAARGGRQIYVETAGRPDYAPTRTFYLRQGYDQIAELANFYAPGDSKVIFYKGLSRS
jgi:GNAT superfamily N-acetyltransferase